MNGETPSLDHVVVDVRDAIDEAVAQYRRLGFTMTERGYHTLGSANHLAVFGTNYLELLGWEPEWTDVRPELTAAARGMNGLVFKTSNAPALFERLSQRGVPVEQPRSFSRPVETPEGRRDARFRTVHFRAGTFGDARVYFCEHLTPELVWRREDQSHPNLAEEIVRVVMTSADPSAFGAIFAATFGGEHVDASGGRVVLPAANARIEIVTTALATEMLGACAPEFAGREGAIAAVTLRVPRLDRAVECLSAAGVAGVDVASERAIIPAAAAMNVALELALAESSADRR